MDDLTAHTDEELKKELHRIHAELDRRKAERKAAEDAVFQAYLDRWAQTPLPQNAESAEVDKETYARHDHLRACAEFMERSHIGYVTWSGKTLALAARTHQNLDEYETLPPPVQRGICTLLRMEYVPEGLAVQYARLRITVANERQKNA